MPPELVDEENSIISKPNDIPNVPMLSKTVNVSSVCDKIIAKMTHPDHKYNTWSKVAIAAHQLEAKQLSNPTNATIEPILDDIEIPLFWYDHLIKGLDKEI